MKPVSFHEKEVLFTLPGNTDVMPLPVLRVTFPDDGSGLASCWKPDWKDRLRILFGKPIYLILWSPIQPPVSITTDCIIQENDGSKKDSA